jgi:hypothetical protein
MPILSTGADCARPNRGAAASAVAPARAVLRVSIRMFSFILGSIAWIGTGSAAICSKIPSTGEAIPPVGQKSAEHNYAINRQRDSGTCKRTVTCNARLICPEYLVTIK